MANRQIRLLKGDLRNLIKTAIESGAESVDCIAETDGRVTYRVNLQSAGLNHSGTATAITQIAAGGAAAAAARLAANANHRNEERESFVM